MEQPKTIIEILNLTKDYFAGKAIESARLNAELLICHALGISRIEIYAKFDKPLSRAETDRLRDMVRRRGAGEPLQYITGEAHFLDFRIAVDNSVLIPRPETEELAVKVIDYIKQSGRTNFKVLDIGTGTGCIAIAIAKALPDTALTAIDISATALKLAEKNAEQNACDNILFESLDILTAVPKEKFDVIVSNPPYISAKEYGLLERGVRDFEPSIALTDKSDGLTFERRVAKILPDMLGADGKFFFELSFEQEKTVCELFDSNRFNTELSQDFQGIRRILSGRLKL